MKLFIFLLSFLTSQLLLANNYQKYNCTVYEGPLFEIGNSGLTTKQTLELDGDIILTDNGRVIEMTSVEDNKVQLKIKLSLTRISDSQNPGNPSKFEDVIKIVKTSDYVIANAEQKVIKVTFEIAESVIIAKCVKIP